ncbi:MAG: class E sortase [Candidatus Nanopelagicales bacterium]|nr:class E sortase [Candidatus Nanopelagicales bacterium]
MKLRSRWRRIVVGLAATAVVLVPTGCASTGLTAAVDPLAPAGPSEEITATAPPAPPSPPPAAPTTAPATPAEPSTPQPRPIPTNAEIRLTVPDAGIRNLRVIRYPGTPDDYRGTQINNQGLAAAPYGPWGGVPPGQVGNFLVTGHRVSAGSPMYRVPNLSPGSKIIVEFGGRTLTYRVASKLWINFRLAADRALQTAPVPGKPGSQATRPAIVLSTCATPEDNAAGLTWRDGNTNPTHRIAIVAYAD